MTKQDIASRLLAISDWAEYQYAIILRDLAREILADDDTPPLELLADPRHLAKIREAGL